MYKNIVFFSAVLIQAISGQILGPFNAAAYGNPLAANVLAEAAIANNLAHPGVPIPGPVGPYGPIVNALAHEAIIPNPLVPGVTNYGLCISELAASHGSGLKVQSTSPISPNGVKVQSENMVMEGPVTVTGQLPFLGTVALEGPLPAAGHGDVAYACGNGNVGIVTEGPELGVPGYPNAVAGLAAAGLPARAMY